MSNLIECVDLGKDYQRGEEVVHALSHVDFSVSKGEYIAILGPSGSGKSTLMHMLGCLDQPSYGQYFLSGRDVSTLGSNDLALVRNRQIGFVFQQFHLLSHATALENVMMPLIYRKEARASREKKARLLLTEMGLAERLNHYPKELSGGQQQRVAIARALVTEPDLILADEPTGNLDSVASGQVMDLFDALHAKGHTIIVVTHDESLADTIPRIVRMKDGCIKTPSSSCESALPGM